MTFIFPHFIGRKTPPDLPIRGGGKDAKTQRFLMDLEAKRDFSIVRPEKKYQLCGWISTKTNINPHIQMNPIGLMMTMW